MVKRDADIHRRIDDMEKAQSERETALKTALSQREAEVNALQREALARKEAELLQAQRAQALPELPAAAPRPSTQPTTPPSEPVEAATSTASSSPRRKRDGLFEHLKLLKNAHQRELIDDDEYEKRRGMILDKYEAMVK